MANLDKEFKYFLQHKEDIKVNYMGKFIVIKDESILGAYDTQKDAIVDSLKTNELGTFLVQQVSNDDNIYTQNFHSRVYVNV